MATGLRYTGNALGLRSAYASLLSAVPVEERIALLQTAVTILAEVEKLAGRRMRIEESPARRACRLLLTVRCWSRAAATRLVRGYALTVQLVPGVAVATDHPDGPTVIAQVITIAVMGIG